MGGSAMITTGDLSQFAVLLKILGYPSGGGITAEQVQEFAFNYNSAAGVNDAFIVGLNPPVTSLKDGLIVAMSSGYLQNNTTSPTLQINSLTPVPIVLWGGSLAPGDIQSGGSYLFIYNEEDNTFQLINPTITTANAFFVQSNFYNSAIDFGVPNAYEVVLNPSPVQSFTIGFPVYMQVGGGNDNTGSSTLTVNGVTDPIYLSNGSAIPAGALLANRVAYFLFSANLSGWVLMNPATTGISDVQSVTGTNNEIDVDNTDPQNPILSLSATLSAPGTFTIQGTTAMNAILDEDNMASDSATALATQQSIKAYVDASVSGAAAFPSGTRMIFQQTSAPTGWTKDVTAAINNGALRTVTGSVGTGGYVPFTTAFTTRNTSGTVGSTTLAISQIPSHVHEIYIIPGGAAPGSNNSIVGSSGSTTNSLANGGGGSHNHTFTGNSMDFNVAYYDVIIAQKN